MFMSKVHSYLGSVLELMEWVRSLVHVMATGFWPKARHRKRIISPFLMVCDSNFFSKWAPTVQWSRPSIDRHPFNVCVCPWCPRSQHKEDRKRMMMMMVRTWRRRRFEDYFSYSTDLVMNGTKWEREKVDWLEEEDYFGDGIFFMSVSLILFYTLYHWYIANVSTDCINRLAFKLKDVDTKKVEVNDRKMFIKKVSKRGMKMKIIESITESINESINESIKKIIPIIRFSSEGIKRRETEVNEKKETEVKERISFGSDGQKYIFLTRKVRNVSTLIRLIHVTK